MNIDNNKTRRKFLGDVLRKGSLAAIGGLVGIALSREACGLSNQNQLDPSSQAQIDQKLILYEEINKPITTGLAEARALTVDTSGILYVAGDQAIKVIDPQGGLRILEF
jgi:uncharacterized membrane protein YebE (DUF533 family)